MRLVLFDIDGTLVPGASSEMRFARFLGRQRRLGLAAALAYVGFLAVFAPRYGRGVAAKNKAYLWRFTPAKMRKLAQDFVRSELLPVLEREAVARLTNHLKAGDHVALLSGTPQFIADALAAELGVMDATGALCATRGQRFAALRPPLRHPFAASKIDAAHELAQRAGLPLGRTIAYGDSFNDRYLFHVVGSAVVVAPGRSLASTAAKSDWEIIAGT